MSKYRKGDDVKIEIKDETVPIGEWVWMLVESCDDERRIVFGILDNQPIANKDIRLGQQLAVSYDNVREHTRFA